MTSPRRIVGFMALAREIVFQTPGLTAQEIYRQAADIAKLQSKVLSAAESPQASLVATLHKHHRKFGLERKKVGREYQYYSVISELRDVADTNSDTLGKDWLALPEELEKWIDALVNLGRFPNRQTAQKELIAIGAQTLIAKIAN